jgi:hypothetical protein
MDRHSVTQDAVVIYHYVWKQNAFVSNSDTISDVATGVDRATPAYRHVSRDRRVTGDIRTRPY